MGVAASASEGTIAAAEAGARPGTADDQPRARTRLRIPGGAAAAAAAPAVAAIPIVVAALSTIGDAWFPVGDLSHVLFRVSQVGTSETPLVGAYTVKGWAHPGPLAFWLMAPLYRLSGADPRSLMWTAALLNLAAVAGIALVAWRRGRWPLLLAAMTVVAVLVHGFGPELTISPWNPYTPLLPFLCTVFLVWDAGLGRRSSLVWAVLPASLAAQSHLAYVNLSGLLVVWLVAWSLWGRRLLPTAAGEPDAEDGPEAKAGETDAGGTADPARRPMATGEAPDSLAALLRRTWAGWRDVVRQGLLVVVVLWLPPLVDAVVDLHNPLHIATSVATPPATVGPIDALGLVGRYVRPDGPWIGGAEPSEFYSIQGSGPLPLVLALALLAGCLWLGRRRELTDVVALSTLSLVLVVGAVPAASQIFLPAYWYLTQFLKIIGALVWLTVAWTGWRLIEPAVRASRPRLVAAATATAAVLVAASAWSWGEAADVPTPNPDEEVIVQDLRSQLDDVLPRDERLRVEPRGDPLNISGPGLIYWLIEDGYDVVSADGARGLKWGHAHRWDRGEPYDRLITVAVYDGYGANDPYLECESARSTELLASYDELRPSERRWLQDFRLRRWDDPSSVTGDETERAERLEADSMRVGVFEGPYLCAEDQPAP